MEEDLLDDQFTQKEDYPNANDYDPNLHGLNGWLAFLGFSLILSTLMTIGLNAKNYYPLIGQFSLITPEYKIWVGLELLLVLVLIAFQLSLIYLYFKKKKIFILIFKLYLAYYVVFEIIDNFVIVPMVNSEPDIASMVKPFVYIIIWMSYISTSKQVKHTFIFK